MTIRFINVGASKTRIAFEGGGWERLSDRFLMIKEKGQGVVRTPATDEEAERIAALVEEFEEDRALDGDVKRIKIDDDETIVRFEDGTRLVLTENKLKIFYPDGAKLFRPATQEDEEWVAELISENPDLVEDETDDDEDDGDESEDDLDDADDGDDLDDVDDVDDESDEEDDADDEEEDDDDDDGDDDDDHVDETLEGDQEDNTIDGKQGRDKIDGKEGNDTLIGGQGRDYIMGGDDDDMIYGNQGRDKLDGGAGNDDINGGNGKDKLIDGEGEDVLTGGRGPDTFVFVVDGEADEVTDFNVRHDHLDLSAFNLDPEEDLDLEDTDDGLLLDLGDGDTILFAGLTIADVSGSDDFGF